MQYTWQLALVLVPVYFIKHSVSCYIYYIQYPTLTALPPLPLTLHCVPIAWVQFLLLKPSHSDHGRRHALVGGPTTTPRNPKLSSHHLRVLGKVHAGKRELGEFHAGNHHMRLGRLERTVCGGGKGVTNFTECTIHGIQRGRGRTSYSYNILLKGA